MQAIILAVGNSGTRLIGNVVHSIVDPRLSTIPYHYEPLYWKGNWYDNALSLNQEAIYQHKQFPLIPSSRDERWPWMEDFIQNNKGLAKFIRAASRIKSYLSVAPKIIWVTRELHAFLGSMQKNFPRCLNKAGWHHRPGKYDDLPRLIELYPNYLTEAENDRIVTEAAWWHAHNFEMYKVSSSPKILHIRYEDFCKSPLIWSKRIGDFLERDIPQTTINLLEQVYRPTQRYANLTQSKRKRIEAIAANLNNQLY